MRIGLVLSSTPAYSETFFRSKIKGLQEMGHEVIIFARHVDSDFGLCKVVKAKKVYRWTFFQLFAMIGMLFNLLFHLSKTKDFIRLEMAAGTSNGEIIKKVYLNAHILSARLDWLHFGFATQALGKEHVAKAIGAKMAVSFRGFDINVYPLKHPNCYQLLWQQVDKVHTISNYLLEKAYKLGLPGTTPYQLITPAVAVDLLPEFKAVKANQSVTFVTIARLHWIKGLDVAISAMALLKERGRSFTYHILGDGPQKEYERYAYQIHQLGLSKQVVLHGKKSHRETLDVLQTANVYLQPSLNEGFCNAVLEAQALGKICVVSNAGGLPENVIDGETGWLFEKNNALALAETIEKVLHLSEEEKNRISKNARTRVLNEFHIQKQQQEFVQFYTDQPTKLTNT